MAVLGGLGHVALRRSGFGRSVLATGGGETAARYSGIDIASLKFCVLVLSSGAAALAGMLYAGRLQSGRLQLGQFQLGEGDSCRSSPPLRWGGPACLGATAP
jgi:ribose transport system permease protein